MGLPADDVMARLLRHRMDRRRTGEVFEFEGASIRLLCELAIAADRSRSVAIRDGEGVLEHFERVADMFRLETGYMRPGKDVPPGMYHAGLNDERNEAWEKWMTTLRTDLFAAVDALRAAGLLPEEGE